MNAGVVCWTVHLESNVRDFELGRCLSPAAVHRPRQILQSSDVSTVMETRAPPIGLGR